jgi:hypothetical protein
VTTINVLQFPEKKEVQGWVCGCGGFNWILYADGECLCLGCNCISTVIRVVRAKPRYKHECPDWDFMELDENSMELIGGSCFSDPDFLAIRARHSDELDRLNDERGTDPSATVALCHDCPPVGYPSNQTRCVTCPRRSAPIKEPKHG